MSKLEAEFQYEIGDVVYFIAAGRFNREPFQVTERIIQQCHGGIQIQYKLIGLEGFVPELCLTTDAPPNPWYSDESRKELQSLKDKAKAARAQKESESP